jgi:uncharacterized membrane protein YqjE
MAEAQANPLSHDIGRSVLKGAIAVVGLVLVRFLVLNLPMVSDASAVTIGSHDALVPIADIVRAVIDTAIFVVIGMTVFNVHRRLHTAGPRQSAAGLLVVAGAAILVIAIAYVSYDPLIPALIGDKQTYNWIFLALGILAVIAFAFLIYRDLDAITEIVFRSGKKMMDRTKSIPPSAEPAAAPAPAPVAAPAPAAAPASAPSPFCTNCGAAVPSGARFCGNCGKAIAAA